MRFRNIFYLCIEVLRLSWESCECVCHQDFHFKLRITIYDQIMKQLNNSTVSRTHRPIRVLQFGEGNFLRAFVDWQLDIANEKGVTDLGVAIVKPRVGSNATIEALRNQDSLFHVCLEGIENGEAKRENRLITVVEEVLTPDDKAEYERIILSPELRFVVSNTTEAGIRFDKDDILCDIPSTFPGKVTNLLWRRFNHFKGDESKGVYFICCELIEDNGSKLKEYVLRHAEKANLGPDFIEWVKRACVFVDTLVDRIVSGAPEDAETVKAELGYDDNAVVKGELYHLWAIGGDGAEALREELPLDKAGLHLLFIPTIKEFRDKKVRILNGSHTGMVAIALLAGCETVLDAFNTPDINCFVSSMVSKEVLPVIDGERSELETFSNGILERFYNPYIRHMLKSISLNSLSKWESRNFDTVKDNWDKRGMLSDHELFTFAALLALYAPASGFDPQDNESHVEYIRSHWNDDDLASTVKSIVSESGIFLQDFDKLVPGFSDHVAIYLEQIRKNGINSALKQFLADQS